MSTDADNGAGRTGRADIQRWLLAVACAAMVTSVLIQVLPLWPNDLRAILLFSAIWASLGALETWLLPLRGVTRIGWMVAAAWSGAALMFYSRLHAAFPGWPWVLSGLCEAGLCWRTRQRAWIWLAVTPLLYATLDGWSDELYDPVRWFFGKLRTLVPNFPGFLEMFGTTTAAVFLLLVVRAVVACFLCRPHRQVPPPGCP